MRLHRVARRWQLRLMLRLAERRRPRLTGVAFIGVTGSCGKTTTKNLAAAVLASRLRGSQSRGSQNLRDEVARTILRTPSAARFCIQEIGASGPGTLDPLIRLLRPRIGIVTNVGSDHHSAFRTLAATAAEKGKLIAALPPDGTAVLNADDPLVLGMAPLCRGRVLTYGVSEGAAVRAEAVSSAWPDRLSFTVRCGDESQAVRTRLVGAHWTPSVLAALAVGRALDVPLAGAVRAVEGVEPLRGRMSPVQLADGITFIRDDWKAPLWSIPAVLDFLGGARARRKVLVLGTISDHSGSSEKYPRVARQALEVADHVFFVGPNAHRCAPARGHARGAALRAFASVRACADFLGGFLQPGDLVVLKGSLWADHLGRIVLSRTSEVACWQAACGRKHFCESCRLLRVPSEVGA